MNPQQSLAEMDAKDRRIAELEAENAAKDRR